MSRLLSLLSLLIFCGSACAAGSGLRKSRIPPRLRRIRILGSKESILARVYGRMENTRELVRRQLPWAAASSPWCSRREVSREMAGIAVIPASLSAANLPTTR